MEREEIQPRTFGNAEQGLRAGVLKHPMIPRSKLAKSFISSGLPVDEIESQITASFGRPAVLLNSARTAIYLALQAAGIRRTDEVIVPHYLSQCVLDTLNRTSFPTHALSDRTRAILPLHQWGYPQRMDDVMDVAKRHRLLVVENCVHTMRSKYKNRNVGLFGDVAVFSFPKVFPTVMGGFMLTDEQRILRYAREYRDSRRGALKRLILNIMMLVVYENQLMEDGPRPQWLVEGLDACYSQYVHFPMASGMLASIIRNNALDFGLLKRREEILDVYVNKLGPKLLQDANTDCQVNPYLVPYFDTPDKLKMLQDSLNRNGVRSSIMHFDTNRNAFEPTYEECIPLPCHQDMDNRSVSMIIDLARATDQK